MANGTPAAVTELLRQWSERSPKVESVLFETVYRRLLEIAEHLLRRERVGHTLDPEGLVHEAFLRLVRQRRVCWRSRGHFFSVSATAMRRVLADHGRRKASAKRGGGRTRVALDDKAVPPETADDERAALQETLERLHQEHPRLAAIVELRFFGGLSLDEVAAVLHRSRTSVIADWAAAREWLAAHHDR